MLVFVSHSSKDRAAVDRIVERLKKDGHDIWIDNLRINPGDNIAKKIEEGLSDSDAFIAVISSNSLQSEYVRQEFSFIALQQISKRQQIIIPVRIDECSVPSYLADRQYVDLSQDFDAGLNILSATLKAPALGSVSRPTDRSPTSSENRNVYVQQIQDALRKGRLTLVCGAGVSVDAKMPAWSTLLLKLLDTLMERMSKDHHLNLGEQAAVEFLKRHGSSSLILGKYLKNTLGIDFRKEVRDALYHQDPKTCPMIDGIVDLARPQRDSNPLDSIITFNFDSLIEEQLTQNRIPNKSIFSESIGHESYELPVYHVHGFLPRSGSIPSDSELVFSEDSYHSQFIDSFSWSNLIQLNKLTQNTCLFVGISLTDPNMRRLLDVAWRKNPTKAADHYIHKRKPTFEDDNTLGRVAHLLEEQDANAIGLNVIWMDTYDDMPDFLRSIATKR